MTDDTARREVAEFWMRRAETALSSASSEIAAGRCEFAVNRVYYACFYGASAVLLLGGRTFARHSGVRGSVHQDLVRTGSLDTKWGKAYDRLFDRRQAADYVELFEVSETEATELLDLARGFVVEMKRLLAIPKAE